MKKTFIGKFFGLLMAFVLLFSSISPIVTGASTEKINYVALGDSLAAGQVALALEKDIGYTGVIAKYLEELSLLESYTNDFAVPGYTSENVLNDIMSNKEVDGVKIKDALKEADFITLTAGANDILFAVDRTTGTSTLDLQSLLAIMGEISVNLSSTVSEIKKLNPDAEVYLSGYYNPFPYLPATKQPQLLSLLASFNTQLKKVADVNGAKFVAIDKMFGNNPTTYFPDPSDIHPSQEGYQLIAQAFIDAFTGKTKLTFTDIPEDFWAYKEIQFLVNNKFISGVSETQFGPTESITRAEAAQTLMSMIPLDQSMPPNPGFTDVSEDHKAYHAIAKLTQVGIFVKAEKFNPDAPLTRAQMAKVLTLSFQLKGTAQSSFTDIPSKHWAKLYVDALASHQVTTGYPDKTFKPNLQTTRAQFAVFVVRAANSMKVAQ